MKFLLPTDESEIVMVDAALTRNQSESTFAITREVEEDSRRRHHAEEALRQSEGRWRLIYEAEPDCVKIISAEGRLETMNPAGLAMVEANSLEEVYGGLALDLIAPESRDDFLAMHRDVIGGQSRRLIYEIIGLKGSRRLLETHAVPMLNADGSVSHLGITRDITHRKQSEELLLRSQTHLAAIISSVDGIVWEMDAESFQFTFVSPQAERLLGYPLSMWTEKPTFWVDHIHSDDREEALQYCVNSTNEKRDHQFEYRMLDVNGREVWLRDIVTVVVENDRPVKLRGIMVDITARKQVEEAFAHSEQRFRELFESSRDAIFVEDFSGQVRDVNPSACRLHDLTREQLLSKNVRDLVPEEELEAIERNFPKLISGELTQTEGLSLRADGTAVPVELSVSGIVYGGQPALLLHVRDITERKQAEALVDGQKEVLELIASGAPLAVSLTALLCAVEEQSADMVCSILLLDADGIHLRHGAAPSLPSEYCRAIDGIAIGPSIGSCGTAAFLREPVIVADIATDSLWADFRDLALRYGLRACWSTPIYDAKRSVLGTFAIYYRCPAQPTEQQLQLIEMATQMAAIAINKEREEATRRKNEEQYRLLADHADDFVALSDTGGGRLYLSPSYYRVTGWTVEELEGTDWRARMHPDDLPIIDKMRKANLAGVATTIEHRILCKDGRWIWAESRCRPILGSDGRVKQLLQWSREITERKRAEEALRESQVMQELVLDSIPQGVFWKDRNSVYVGANRVARRAMGIDAPQGVLGKTDVEVANFSRDQAECFVQKDREVIQSGQPQFGIVETMSLADGSTIWLETNKLPILDSEGNVTGVLGTWQDITERKRSNEQLNASHERLEILSRLLIEAQESERRHLARELHDEIGQALTGIKLNLKALQQPTQSARSKELVKDTLEVVDQTLQQVRNLALDLRPSMLDDIGLVAALRWCLDRQSQRAGITPHFAADSFVSSASPEIETACFRIVQESLTNVARHANARNVRVDLRQHDSELELLVQDDGVGFDVSAARHRAAHGASIGLLGMEERVQLVGGFIEIESILSQGTTIRVQIPLPVIVEPPLEKA